MYLCAQCGKVVSKPVSEQFSDLRPFNGVRKKIRIKGKFKICVQDLEVRRVVWKADLCFLLIVGIDTSCHFYSPFTTLKMDMFIST